MDQIKDPFTAAQSIEIDDEGEVNKKLREIAEKIGKPAAVPMLCTSAKQKTHIQGALPEGVCAVCKEKVWLAPSSQEHMKLHSDVMFLLCFGCLEANGITMRMLVNAVQALAARKLKERIDGVNEKGKTSTGVS